MAFAWCLVEFKVTLGELSAIPMGSECTRGRDDLIRKDKRQGCKSGEHQYLRDPKREGK